MVIDFHVHYGTDLDGTSASLKDIQSEMKSNGIAQVALFPFNMNDLVSQSRQILELSRQQPWIIPFLRFEPQTIAREQLRELLAFGFKGVKLHSRSQQFHPDDPQFHWIFEEILPFRIPILFHTKDSMMEPMSDPRRVIALAKRFPEQIFVIGHAAGGGFWLYEEVAACPNVYVETSIFSIPKLFEEIYQRYGFDRFIYGSDLPYSHPEIELLKIKRAKIPEEVKEKILFKNALTVLRMESAVVH